MMESTFWFFFVLVFLFAGIFGFYLSRRSRISLKARQRLKTHWARVLAEAEKNPKQAILEADKILNETLHLKGYGGTVGEKLKRAHSLFSDINGIWRAHKLRNRIAHELDVNVSSRESQSALDEFRRAFKDLGIL